MSKPGDDNNANNGNKEMKGLVVAAAMIAAGDGSTKQSSGEAAAKKTSAETSASAAPTTTSSGRGKKPKDVTASRARRLEQNRRAAIESRRRKKVMIGELQRSITFYTKANENLAYDNQDLEHKLFIARNQVLEMGGNVPDVTILNMQPTPVASSAVVELKSPPEDVKMPAAVMSNTHNIMELKPPAESSQHDEQLQQNQPQQQPIAPPAIAIPFPPLNPSVSPDHSQLAATLQTMGYPSDAARVAANAYTQFVVPIGGVPSTTNVLNAASSNRPDVPVQQQLPTEEEVGSDKYIECLQQFAMQQTAAANAAAAAANAAIQALAYHKMMKANRESNPQPTSTPNAPISMLPVPVLSAALAQQTTSMSTAFIMQPPVEEQGPPTKKQRS